MNTENKKPTETTQAVIIGAYTMPDWTKAHQAAKREKVLTYPLFDYESTPRSHDAGTY